MKAALTGGLYDKITVKNHAAADVDQKVADAEIEYERILPELVARRKEEERALRERQDELERKRELQTTPTKPDFESSPATSR